MSLKIRVPARLKALFAGVALSKKSIDAITEKASVGLTDESTDEEIDAVLNARNEIWSFDEQRKFDDYQAGKASKDAADKEAKRLADIAAGKEPEPPVDPNETPTEKLLKQALAGITALTAEVSAIKGEKVTNTRREQYIKTLEGTDDKFKAKALRDFDRIAFKDDEDFNSFLAEAETDAADFAKTEDTENGIGSSFRPTGGAGGSTGGKGEASQAEVDAAFKNFKL